MHLDSCWKVFCAAICSCLFFRDGVITAERTRDRCRAALVAGLGLWPCELIVRKKSAATS